MKNSVLLIFLLLALQSTAQYNSEGDIKSRFRPGTFWFFTGFTPARPEKLRKYDRLIFDLTYNDWVGDKKPFKNHWSSIGFNTNLMFDIPMAKRNVVSFGIGFCYGFQVIRHDQDILYSLDSNYTQVSNDLSMASFDKNSFVGHNFSIPIEFRFRTKGWKHFKVHVGGKIGYQAQFYSKTRYEGEDTKFMIKDKSIPDFNRLTYSAHVRIGIRNWALFGSYNFNPVFSGVQSTKLNMIQLGLSISLF